MATSSTLRIAWRNLGRSRKRTFLALGAIAVGQLAFLATAALLHGYAEQYFDSATGPLVGHIQVHAPEWRDDRSIDLTIRDIHRTTDEIRKDPNVAQVSPRIFAPVLAALTEDGFMGMVVGIDPALESHESGLLGDEGLSGRIGDRRILVGRVFAQKYDMKPGMKLAVIGQDVDGSIANDLFTIADIISSPVAVVSNIGIVMSLHDAQELLLMPDQAHEIVIHVDDMDLLDETVLRLSSIPLLAGMEVLPWQKIVPHIVSMIKFMDIYLFIILFIVFLAAAAGIANTMFMSTFERTHEFGMLLALGCGPGRLSRMIAMEAVVLGLLGAAIGTVLGLGFFLLTSETGINYAALGGNENSVEMAYKGLQISFFVFPKLYVRDVVFAVCAVLLTSFISVIWPMLHIARLAPMEAMRS